MMVCFISANNSGNGRKPLVRVGMLAGWMLFAPVLTAGIIQPPGPPPPVHELMQELSGDYSGLAEQEDPRFGFSVAMYGTTLVVGAPGTRVGGTPDRGAVFVFRQTAGQWELAQRLLPGLGTGGGQCGYSVAVDTYNVLIGCPFQNVNGQARGRARLYTRSNPSADFEFSTDFEDIGDLANAQCGRSVALLGAADSGSFPLVAVGCPGRGSDQGGGIVTVPGAVDIYYWLLGWEYATSVIPPGAAPTGFGSSLSLAEHSGDVLLAVGRPGTTNGQVMIYAMGDIIGDWALDHTYTGTGGTELGFSVHMRGQGPVAQLIAGDPTRTVLVYDGNNFVNVPVGSFMIATRVCAPEPPSFNIVCNWLGSTLEYLGSAAGGTGAQNRLGHAVNLSGPGRFIAGEPKYRPDDPKGRAGHYGREDGEWVVNGNEPFYNLPNLFNLAGSEFGASLASTPQGWLAIGAPRYQYLLVMPGDQSMQGKGTPLGRVFVYAYGNDLFSDRFEE